MAAQPYLIDETLQTCIPRWLAQNKPGKQILILFFEQALIEALALCREARQYRLYKRQQQ
jgi:hypothetical protein